MPTNYSTVYLRTPLPSSYVGSSMSHVTTIAITINTVLVLVLLLIGGSAKSLVGRAGRL